MEEKYLLMSVICVIFIIIIFTIIKLVNDKSDKNSKAVGVTFIEFIFYLFTFLSPFGFFIGCPIELCIGSFITSLFFGNIITWLRRIYNQKYED